MATAPNINNATLTEAYAVRARVKNSEDYGFMKATGGLVTRLNSAELYQTRALAEEAGRKARNSKFDNVDTTSFETVLVQVIQGTAEAIP